ncbi:hypothetical protein [Microbacterium sp. 5K110]|jgi:hypothetical protein|uniref:hypothetical protein n=1 Tax=unclassified Microbacterium TaxID=2609290 RepID=UPI00148577F8|nr:hypothetical protein [Microbacterium sp. 5K110]
MAHSLFTGIRTARVRRSTFIPAAGRPLTPAPTPVVVAAAVTVSVAVGVVLPLVL